MTSQRTLLFGSVVILSHVACTTPHERYSGDAGADANPPDAPPVDAFVNPDAFFSPYIVTTTAISGPGSLAAVVAYVNEHCVAGGERQVISFDIPTTDPGFVTEGGQSFWRIQFGAGLMFSMTLTCAVEIDGASQTQRRGNTNTASFGGMPVGMAARMLPRIEGPEIEIRNFGIQADAGNVYVHHIAFSSFTTSFGGSRMRIEQCLLGSEPYALVGVPAGGAAASLVYASASSQLVLQSNAFVWSAGTPSNNGIALASLNAEILDNVFTGRGGGGGWDEVHFTSTASLRIDHNDFAGANWQFHIDGDDSPSTALTQNTFHGPVPERSAGTVASIWSGNLTVP